MLTVPRWLDRATRHLEGTRVLTLPLLRGLAVLFGVTCVLTLPAAAEGQA